MKKISVKRIEYDSKECNDELFLRSRILREPLGLSIFDDDLSSEREDIHIGAFCGEDLAGAIVLAKYGKNTIKMRQVAVKKEMQRMGIGAKMVRFCEQTAASEGFSKIVLHARKTAVEFYEKLGYIAYGEEFTEVGIAHRAMQKQI